MTRPSPEIEAIVRRFTTAIRNHDVADLPHYMSENNAMTYVGTAGGEVWRGPVVREGISAHLAEVPDFSEDNVEIEAFENGDTGWALYTSQFTFHGTGATGTHRATFVFVMEHGAWKMIQHHISEGGSNVAKLGIEHTAFQSLLAAARAEKHDFGSEGLASIMFTDIAGSTELAAAMGDRLWLSVLTDHVRTVKDCIENEGGTLVKSLGDGTMSAFTSARAAVSAARSVRNAVAETAGEPALRLRVGIHTGEVIRSQDDFFGSVVNKAARIADLSEPGQITVSDATRIMVGDGAGFRFGTPVSVRIKGLEGDHVLVRLEDQE